MTSERTFNTDGGRTMAKWYDKLVKKVPKEDAQSNLSWLRALTTGSLYKISDIRKDQTLADIHTQIDTMRALARDSQISTALSYYATDATTVNTKGQVIWATAKEGCTTAGAEVANDLFVKWKVNSYVRDHILELATIGNLYMPTTDLYRDFGSNVQKGVVLDNNTIADQNYEPIPAYMVPPETIIHVWEQGKPIGYIMSPDENIGESLVLPESAVIHFSLGGLLGDYTIESQDSDGTNHKYDIQFATPLMAQAVQPTQTLGLLEDALLLSSLSRTVKFMFVDCGRELDEQRETLEMMKSMVEQQFSINTSNGDAQSFINPQSPNNIIYLPRVNGQDPISTMDLNMGDAQEAENNLLNYYQDKKLSVLGVPKEAMNFSSNEGLGGAGAVLSQRSALYANSLQRLETAYMAGWTDALNKYFEQHNFTGLVDTFDLHMNPIVTIQSTVQFDKRDAAIAQAGSLVELLKSIGEEDREVYRSGLVEILSEVFPQIGASAAEWDVNVEAGGEEDAF